MNEPIIYGHSDHTLDYIAWRKVVFDCPHCDFDPDKAFIWMKRSQIREILFVSGIFYKKGHTVVVSECPECFENSWHHYGLDRLARKEILDTEKIETEIGRLVQLANEEWDRSMCKGCSVPREVDKNKYGFWIHCSIGRHSPPQQFDEKEPFRCTKYTQVIEDE